MDWDVSIASLSTALGIGLLVGTVRERHQAPDRIGKAGLRTHALLALTGALAAGFGTGALLVALAAVAALAVAGYRAGGATHDPGLTGEVAMLVSVLLGAVAQQSPALAAGLGVLVAALLWAKAPLRRLSQELISEREVQDGLLLAASALVILPLLPDRAVDPWGVVQLSTLWKIVVLIMATGMMGHVARRAVGARLGLPASAPGTEVSILVLAVDLPYNLGLLAGALGGIIAGLLLERLQKGRTVQPVADENREQEAS